MRILFIGLLSLTVISCGPGKETKIASQFDVACAGMQDRIPEAKEEIDCGCLAPKVARLDEVLAYRLIKVFENAKSKENFQDLIFNGFTDEQVESFSMFEICA